MIPQPLQDLIKRLAKLPGLGARSAQRAALSLLAQEQKLLDLQRALEAVRTHIQTCHVCGNFDVISPCALCTDARRDATALCVVEQVDDMWALERNKIFRGRYHILGGVVNALDGIRPEDLRLPQLLQRLQVPDNEITEVILALSAGVDGQTTAYLVAQAVQQAGVQVTSLAQGVPVGASVDYLDEGTLAIAFQGRKVFG